MLWCKDVVMVDEHGLILVFFVCLFLNFCLILSPPALQLPLPLFHEIRVLFLVFCVVPKPVLRFSQSTPPRWLGGKVSASSSGDLGISPRFPRSSHAIVSYHCLTPSQLARRLESGALMATSVKRLAPQGQCRTGW